jgi:DNA primase
VRPVRKIWPSFKGAAIRLWRGDSGLSIERAAAHGLRETLVLCEGVEDGLSLAMALPECRIWAVGTLGNIGAQVLPECVDDVIVCADNDWGKPQAERQLTQALARLSAQGVEVRVARSHVGKDVNDALRGAA